VYIPICIGKGNVNGYVNN